MSSLQSKNCFIEGEVVYLRKPDIEKDISNGLWHQWFNDEEITRYLVHGVFPNDINDQARIIEEQLKTKSSLLLSIIDKTTDEMIGVVSLKSIDLVNRIAEIAIVMGFKKVSAAAIEAMALLTQHAFDRLNLNKLYAGQHEELWKWVNTLETIGYKLEGFRRSMGIRNGQAYNVALTGITSEDYYKIKNERGGKLIDSFEAVYARKRKENIFSQLQSFLEELNKLG